MKLFYCPKCKKEEIREDNPYRHEETILNMRDGWGRPIQHYKCECGNYLAGSMDINGWADDPDAILYCKETIEGYNPGGCYYDGYNMWRYTLEGFKGDVAFQELIDFADNEGVIGSVLSQKLYDDFKNNYEEAIKYSKTINDGDWFIRKYEDWMEAFNYARQNGAVNFE